MHEGIPDTTATKHYITEDQLPICKEVENTIWSYITVAAVSGIPSCNVILGGLSDVEKHCSV